MVFRSTRPLLAPLAAVCVLALPAAAQNGTGTVTGTITDTQGAALDGVKVTLEPGDYTILTNQGGRFLIPGVTAGQHTLTATYAGFTDGSQPVAVASGQPVDVKVSLGIASNSENITVYAPRVGGELEAISRTFNADNIINVLPADVITSLPNANVADAIGRLPDVTLERDEGEGKYVKVRGTEPRLNHTTLDGVTLASPETGRQIKLDLIPADLVSSVQINKTLQANMEADGIGGSIDLRTKQAEDRPTVYLDSEGGYNPIIGGRSNYMFDGTLGQRFGSGKKFGALVSASYDWNGRGINDVEPGPALTGTYDQRDYQYFRSRYGFGGTLDYRINQTSSLYLKYLYSRFNDYGDDWIYTPKIQTFLTATQGGDDGSMHFQGLSRRPVQDIGGLQLGGRHVLGRTLFNWNVNSSLGRTRDEGYTFENFAPIGALNPLNNIPFALDVSNPYEPHLTPVNGVNIYDPTKYSYVDKEVENTYLPEVDLGFGASLSIPYTVKGHVSTFEFGGLFRNEHKFENQDTLWYAPLAPQGDPSLAMSNFIGPFTDPGYYGGAYHEGPVVNTDQVQAFGPLGPDPNNSNVIGNSFDQREKVSAGYVMNTTNFGEFRFNVGFRLENTSENNLGYFGQTSDTNQAVTGAPILAQYSYLSFLPSASVRYALTPMQGVRIVYSRGLARPNFSDLVPFQSAPSGGTARDTVTQGNPYLQAEFADDIDLLYENNLSHSGLLTAGFYYKHISSPIVPVQSVQPQSNQTTGPYILDQSVNAGNAHVYGFEIAFIQHFTQLPGLFSGLGVSANYGYTSSQIVFPPYVDPTTAPVGTIIGPDRGPEGANPALIGQAPNSYNFSPTYDKRNLSVRFGMTYNGPNIYAYNYSTTNNGPITIGGNGGGPQGPNGDQYFYSHLQLDIQGSYRLPKGFTAVAYGLNLNNEVFGFYQGSGLYPVQREFYRQTLGGGLRWSPRHEN